VHLKGRDSEIALPTAEINNSYGIGQPKYFPTFHFLFRDLTFMCFCPHIPSLKGLWNAVEVVIKGPCHQRYTDRYFFVVNDAALVNGAAQGLPSENELGHLTKFRNFKKFERKAVHRTLRLFDVSRGCTEKTNEFF
jgi:hypothetical protein